MDAMLVLFKGTIHCTASRLYLGSHNTQRIDIGKPFGIWMTPGYSGCLLNIRRDGKSFDCVYV